VSEAVETRMGRPLLVPTPEEFERRVSVYFDECRQEQRPVTMAGMALALGLKKRQTIHEYGKRKGYEDIVAWAMLHIEDRYEQRLHTNAPTGAIFALKNLGWTDKTEVEHSGNVQLDVKAVRERVENRINGIASRLLTEST